MKHCRQERKQKDQFFKKYQESPIPFEERRNFQCLDYYPPDPKSRFELNINEHSDKKRIHIEDTGGNLRNMIRWGEFRFQIGDAQCTLQAYKSDPHEDKLFIPFKDATSGNETYGAGRYLDLDYRKDHTPEGKWILDLNKAYNPWCAYSKNYVCPFVPPENWLKVPVHAGEKKYHKENG
ncbi:MAG: DUF1684 domain-containing protein [Deltaproteobacteria bacterium]|nr:DUF1684 domain-containing protein [Deltaproteobacteria bacterium]